MPLKYKQDGFFNKEESSESNTITHFNKKFCQINDKIVAIGASAGGVQAIREILRELPDNITVPIVITQHLSAFYHKLEQLIFLWNIENKIKIKLAKDGDFIESGVAYFCPAARHMEVILINEKPCLKLSTNPEINHNMPCIDLLFHSIAQIYKEKALAIILTGMMRDGVDGLGEVRKTGGRTIAESEETAAVFGMPKKAIEEGAAEFIVPNYDIKNYIIRFATVHDL